MPGYAKDLKSSVRYMVIESLFNTTLQMGQEKGAEPWNLIVDLEPQEIDIV